MKAFFISILAILGISFGTTRLAAFVFIETVSVSDTNNVADPLTGYGAVKENYKIATTEITAAQYCAFLNAIAKHADTYGLYNKKMGSDTNVASIQQIYDPVNNCYLYKTMKGAENFPITYVSWSSAARFCNWLHHNQPEGNEGPMTTEQGAYNLDGFMGGIVPVEKDAIWSLPTEDQWYKAAYYKGGGTDAGYWFYPTQHNAGLDNSMTGDRSNNANIFMLKKETNWWGTVTTRETYAQSSAPFLTSVDAFSNSAGYYQTYDMGGNVFEWVDASRQGLDPDIQVVRGGAWSKEFGVSCLQSSYRNKTNIFSSETNTIGFRVVMQPQHLALSWVTVGDPGNPADSTGYGAVSEVFCIGKYPITVEQYCFFLNRVASTGDPYNLCTPWMQDPTIDGPIVRTTFAGHFHYSVRPGREKVPMNYVDWFFAARFCNWLQHGCPEGNQDDSTTETGAYTMNGRCDGAPIPVNKNARYYIPSEDQWYKAAYYNGHGGYYEYPTQSDVAPGKTLGDEPNQANYDFATTGTDYAACPLTPIGLFKGTESYYGACDMGGNVWEWNSTVEAGHLIIGPPGIEARGGSFKTSVSSLKKEASNFFYAGRVDVGFRLAAPAN